MLALAFSSSTVFAQRSVNTGAGAGGGGFWEFGTDFAALIFGMDDPSTTDFNFGFGTVRAGRFIADNMSIEPVVVFSYGSTSGGPSGNFLGAEVGFLYHFQADRTQQQFFVRPGFSFNRTSTTSGGTTVSNNRTAVMVGAGIKRPSKKNARFSWRGEARFTNMMKSGSIPSSSELAIIGGVSVYTR
jgi:hypothetical protein